jgi:hypothetical protein
MQLSIDTKYSLAVNNDYMIIWTKLCSINQELGHVYGGCELTVNDYWSCMWVNWKASCMLWFITYVLAALIDKRTCDTDTAQCWQWESPEWTWFVLLNLSQLGSDFLAVMHNRSIGSHYSQMTMRHGNSPIFTMSVKGASRIFGYVRNLIGKWFACCYL